MEVYRDLSRLCSARAKRCTVYGFRGVRPLQNASLKTSEGRRSGSDRPTHLTYDWRTAGYGASFSSPYLPAKVSSLNTERPLSLGGGNWPSCPITHAGVYRRGSGLSSNSLILVASVAAVNGLLSRSMPGSSRSLLSAGLQAHLATPLHWDRARGHVVGTHQRRTLSRAPSGRTACRRW